MGVLMKDIKVRAWHKKLKKMVYFNEPGFNQEYALFCLSPTGEFDHCELPGSYGRAEYGDVEDINGWEVMFYTGLGDKNGKEVYEGDIIRTDKADYRGKPCIVEWYKEAAAFWLRDPKAPEGEYWSTLAGAHCFTTLDRIGNIYENKELLA